MLPLSETYQMTWHVSGWIIRLSHASTKTLASTGVGCRGPGSIPKRHRGSHVDSTRVLLSVSEAHWLYNWHQTSLCGMISHCFVLNGWVVGTLKFTQECRRGKKVSQMTEYCRPRQSLSNVMHKMTCCSMQDVTKYVLRQRSNTHPWFLDVWPLT